MLYLLVPLVLLPFLYNWAGVQALAAALAGAFYLARTAAADVTFSPWHLPWLLAPMMLLVWTPTSLEFYSELGLLNLALLGLGACVLLLPMEKGLFWAGLTIGGLGLAGQAWGLLAGKSGFAISSFLGQENAYQFFNLNLLGLSGYIWLFVKNGRRLRLMAVGVGTLALLSLYAGDGPSTGRWGFSPGDSLGNQLALPAGIAFFLLWRALARAPLFHGPRRLAALALMAGLGVMLAPVMLSLWEGWGNSSNSSLTSRISLWRAVLSLCSAMPGLGAGHGALGRYVLDFWPNRGEALFAPVQDFTVAHCHFLHALGELGLPLGLLFWGLWLTPLVLLVWRYSLSRDSRFLYMAGWLFAVLCAMSVLEVTQLFAAPSLLAWALLLTCLRLGLGESQGGVRLSKPLRGGALALLLCLFAVLALDRARQLGSQRFTARYERGADATLESLGDFSKALSAHPRNALALYYQADLWRQVGKLDSAYWATDRLIAMGGSRHGVHRLRAQIWHAAGRDDLACNEAWRVLRYSGDEADRALAAWAGACPMEWVRKDARL